MTLLSLSRAVEYESYLIAQLAPSEQREQLHLLNALRGELMKAPRLNPEPALAAIRLKWWQDALGDIRRPAHGQNHPVLLALADSPLRDADFLPWITARETEITARQGVATTEAFYTYLDQDVGHWFTLAAHDAQPLARAYGILQLLRRLPQDIARKQIIWPRDSLQQFGLTPNAVDADDTDARLHAFVKHWATTAEALIQAPPPDNAVLRRYRHVTQSWLAHIAQKEYSLTRLAQRRVLLPLTLWLNR